MPTARKPSGANEWSGSETEGSSLDFSDDEEISTASETEGSSEEGGSFMVCDSMHVDSGEAQSSLAQPPSVPMSESRSTKRRSQTKSSESPVEPTRRPLFLNPAGKGKELPTHQNGGGETKIPHPPQLSSPTSPGGGQSRAPPPTLAACRHSQFTLKTVNGSIKLRKILQELQEARSQGNVDTEGGVGDGSLRQMRAGRGKLQVAKEKAAKQILDIGVRISCEAAEVKRMVLRITEDIFQETDHHPGNPELFSALSRIVSLDLPLLIQQRNWLVHCCQEGCSQYLNTMLSLPDIADWLSAVYVQSLLQLATKQRNHKAKLFSILAKYAPNIPAFAKNADVLTPSWQLAFEKIAHKAPPSSSPQKGMDGEADYGGTESDEQRHEALMEMIAHPTEIPINFMRESWTDKQTIFSRAARDGEVVVMLKLLQIEHQRLKGGGGGSPYGATESKPTFDDALAMSGASSFGAIIDVNRVSTDGSTALMQAVVADQKEVVVMLLKWPGTNLFVEHPTHGTVLDIAAKKGKYLSNDILNALKAAVQESGISAEEAGLSPEELREKRQATRSQNIPKDCSDMLRPMLHGALPQFENLVRIMTSQYDQPLMIREASQSLAKTKANLVTKCNAVPHIILLAGKEECDMMINCVHATVQANERKAGSLDFLKAIFDAVAGPMNWAEICVEKEWLLQCVKDTSSEFLELLLGLPRLGEYLHTDQLVSVATMIAENRALRIPMMKTLLTAGEETLRLTGNPDRLKVLNPILCDFFTSIASSTTARAREDRRDRISLLGIMLSHPSLDIDVEKESSTATDATTEKIHRSGDGLSIFVRAAQEGDTDLVRLLLKGSKQGKMMRKLVRTIDQPVTADKSTALVRAVLNGHTATAELLVKVGAADPNYSGFRQGTPLQIAQKRLNKDPVMISVLGGSASVSAFMDTF